MKVTMIYYYCDNKACDWSEHSRFVDSMLSTTSEGNRQLAKAGWKSYRGKHLCEDCIAAGVKFNQFIKEHS